MFGLGAALGIGAIGASLFNSWQNREAVADANVANSRLSWDMWHATNAYNHPKAQMRRFKEAGLNPHLIYGQMANVSPPAHVHNQPLPGIDLDLRTAMDFFNSYQNSKNLDSMIGLRETERKIAERDANRRSDEYFDNLSLQPLQRENLRLKNDLLQAQIDEIQDSPTIDEISRYLGVGAKGAGVLATLKYLFSSGGVGKGRKK